MPKLYKNKIKKLYKILIEIIIIKIINVCIIVIITKLREELKMSIRTRMNIEAFFMGEGFFVSLDYLDDDKNEEFESDYLEKLKNLINLKIDPESIYEGAVEPLETKELGIKDVIKNMDLLKQSWLDGVDLKGCSFGQYQVFKKLGIISSRLLGKMGKFKKKMSEDVSNLVLQLNLAGFETNTYAKEFESLKKDLNSTYVDVSMFLRNKSFLLFEDTESIINCLKVMQNSGEQLSAMGDELFSQDFYNRSKHNLFVLRLMGFEIEEPMPTMHHVYDYLKTQGFSNMQEKVKGVKLEYNLTTIDDAEVFDVEKNALSDVSIAMGLSIGYDFSKIEQIINKVISYDNLLAFMLLDQEGIDLKKYIEDIELTGESSSYKDFFNILYFGETKNIDIPHYLSKMGGIFSNQEDSLFAVLCGLLNDVDVDFCMDLTYELYQEQSFIGEIINLYRYALDSGVSVVEISEKLSLCKSVEEMKTAILLTSHNVKGSAGMDIEEAILNSNEYLI